MNKYALAQQRIALGLWLVDAERGVVSSAKYRRPLAGASPKGYVELALVIEGGKNAVLAHRVIWESVHGPIPEGLQINHKNGNKSDNRITNLELVTGSENVKHAFDTGLAVQPKGEASSVAKLTETQVLEMRARYRAGEMQRDLAAEFGLHRAYVSLLMRGKRWAHLPV